MDLILYNGKIRIGRDSYAQGIGIKDKIIQKIGTNEEVLALKENKTRLVDLEGRLVLPGLNDSHMHFLEVGYYKQQIDLSGTKSIEEAITVCKKFISENNIKKGQWIQGTGWNEDNWEEKRTITKEDLDRISTENPIFVVRVCEHIFVLNTNALKAVGINEKTPQPKEGGFEVDNEGKPTGKLMEMRYIIHDIIPNPTVDEIKEMIMKAAEAAVSVGLTAVQTDDFKNIPGHNYNDIIKAYMELSKEGRLPLRVYEQCALPNKSVFNSFIRDGHQSGEGDEMFKLGPLKLFCDGSLGARTAWLKDDYSDDPGNKGLPLYKNPEELYTLVEEAHKRHMAVAIHCIGDAAAEQAVSAIENAIRKYPNIKNRHGIIHAQVLSKVLVDRIKKANIIAYIQPIFIEYDMHMAEKRIGRCRLVESYNWRELYDNGVCIPFGTDCPVESFNPMPNIFSAVARKDLNCQPNEGWYKEQALTIDEAIEAYTQMSAYASYSEKAKGQIKVGMYADLTILDEDIYDIPIDRIKDVKTAMTIVCGDIKYSLNK